MGLAVGVKSAMLAVIRGASRAGVTRVLPAEFVDKMYKRALDERVVQRALAPATLRRSGASVLCNPYTYTHRSVLLFGEMYERATERILHRMVRAGDTFVDVGANSGHVTMVAAALVGPQGKVRAFEPNPMLAAKVREHATNKGVNWVELSAEGLGSEAGEFELTVDPLHLGGAAFAKFRPGEMHHAKNSQTFRVPVRVGDDALATLPCMTTGSSKEPAHSGAMIIKIDVEGAEPSVVAGLSRTLVNHTSAVMIEVSPKWIGGREGVEDLFAMFHRAGLKAFDFDDLEHNEHAKLRAVTPADVHGQCNVLFVREAFSIARGLV